jgi:DNA-binding NtrC family response regulator
MNGILIYAADEYAREMLKAALVNHLPLIITEDRGQCLDILQQKTNIKKAFIAACDAEDNADLELFEEILELKPELKVIAVGDHDTEDIAAKAVKHGAAGYIILPAEANAILTLAR